MPDDSAFDEPGPTVGIIMGSASDLPTMQAAADELERFGVDHEVRVVSAHRSPARMVDYARSARHRGLRVIIAGAGGAAHLPGMVASMTTLPVIGVPVATRHLGGVDSLHSIVQMPGGVPVATMAIGGARNAGLMAVRILAVADDRLAGLLDADQDDLEQHAIAQDAEVRRPADGGTSRG
jgi:5-(carboxyamino)imidazole ribonucleotide mutase